MSKSMSMNSLTAVPLPASSVPLALQREPSRLKGWHGEPRLFSYAAEVQPVLDRYCVRCHDYGQPAGQKLNLAGDRDLVFSASYIELWQKGYVKVVGAGPPQTQPTYSWGSHRSRLIESMCGESRGVHLDVEDWDRLVTWIDLNAPFYPSYASVFPENLAGRAPLTGSEIEQLEKLTGVPFRGLAAHNSNRGPQISFDRPELSPCLARFTDRDDPPYQQALKIIRAGSERLKSATRATVDDLAACSLDEWRQENYVKRAELEAQHRAALRDGRKAYDQPVEAVGSKRGGWKE